MRTGQVASRQSGFEDERQRAGPIAHTSGSVYSNGARQARQPHAQARANVGIDEWCRPEEGTGRPPDIHEQRRSEPYASPGEQTLEFSGRRRDLTAQA